MVGALNPSRLSIVKVVGFVFLQNCLIVHPCFCRVALLLYNHKIPCIPYLLFSFSALTLHANLLGNLVDCESE